MMFESVNVVSDSFYDVYTSPVSVMGPGSSGGPLLVGNYVIGVKSTGSWWADLGGDAVYDHLTRTLASNDSLLGVVLDTTAPTVVSYSPADGATGVAVGSNLVIQFSESVVRGAGTIVLKTAAGSVIESFNAASSSAIGISGSQFTLNPTLDLLAGTSYVLVLPSGSVKDAAGNAYAGTASYDFTTAAASNQGTPGADSMVGTPFADSLFANNGNDSLQGLGGDDLLDGGAGIDRALYASPVAHYAITKTANGFQVRHKFGSDGTDTLVAIEKARFSDKTVDLTVGMLAASVPTATLQSIVELYIAFFDRVPDSEGMAYWLGQAFAGAPVTAIAESFYSAAIQYSALTGYSGSMSNADFVGVIYQNVLGRSSVDAGGLAYWTTALANGSQTRGTLVKSILDSAHTFKGDAVFGVVADLLDNKYLVGKRFAVDLGLSFNTSEASISEGMRIADAVTATNTSVAISMIGVQPADIQLV